MYFAYAETEKKLVSEVFNNAVDSLSDEDRTLPQVDLELLLSTPIHFTLLNPTYPPSGTLQLSPVPHSTSSLPNT